LAIFASPATLSAALVVLRHAAMAASPAWLTGNDDKIKAIVEKMTRAEKVAQMPQPDSGTVIDLDDTAAFTGVRHRSRPENKKPAPRGMGSFRGDWRLENQSTFARWRRRHPA
jgi:hypothetical protein